MASSVATAIPTLNGVAASPPIGAYVPVKEAMSVSFCATLGVSPAMPAAFVATSFLFTSMSQLDWKLPREFISLQVVSI